MWTEPVMEARLSEVDVAAIGVDRFSGGQRLYLRSRPDGRGISLPLTPAEATALLTRFSEGATVEDTPYAVIAALFRDNGLTPLRVVISPVDGSSGLLYHDGVEDRLLEMSAAEGVVLAAYLDLPLMVEGHLLVDIDPELVARRRRMDVLYLGTV
ncbi:MAG: hypothetical protein ACLFUX_02575 [Spirochaetaceae bacterium]